MILLCSSSWLRRPNFVHPVEGAFNLEVRAMLTAVGGRFYRRQSWEKKTPPNSDTTADRARVD
jgi:hypothetical protein